MLFQKVGTDLFYYASAHTRHNVFKVTAVRISTFEI
jgi:hypothetical protein